MRLKPVIGCALLAASAGCASTTPLTLSDDEALGICRTAAREHPRRGEPEVITVRERVSRSGAEPGLRVECRVDLGQRQILSATVDGVERVRGPRPL